MVPTKNEIEWEVKRLRNHRSRGPSGIRTDHIKGRLVEARKEGAVAAQTAVVEGTTSVLGEAWGGRLWRREGRRRLQR